MPDELRTIQVTVNGTKYDRQVRCRKLLSDFIREDLRLVGTHVGCEHGICGACTVLFNGQTIRSCLMFAVQADGAEITTVEGLARGGQLHPLQEAFWENHGVQCGYCTPGFLLTALELLQRNPNPTEEEVRIGIAGNICRCTGYQHIIESVLAAAAKMGAKTV
ncbi:MAG: (2Fe-2S)-binding protein [Acidobacteria bacterium]|nr:(2Fe-2S)-binding protein [Acidobacteriota bacterium]